METARIAREVPPDRVAEEIRVRLRAQRMRGDFAAIHLAPAGPQEVPDQAGARLVVLGPEHAHPDGAPPGDSPALDQAAALLREAQAGVPRAYRNMLVFLAPDAGELARLRQGVREWVARRADAEGAGSAPAADELRRREEALGALVGQTWQWLLAPGPAGWRTSRALGRGELAMRASRQLRDDEALFVEYPATRLRADLDRIPLWPPGQDHVALAEVWEAYARSVELPRLRSSAVLAAAVVHGIAAPDWAGETFAYAESWQPERRRFDGLRAGYQGTLVLQGSGLIVRAPAAQAQLEAEAGAA